MRHVDTSFDCWLWTAARDSEGYGKIGIQYGPPGETGWKQIRATHVAYRLAYGEWPRKNQMVCHTCDVPSCVKPSHLWLGTAGDNRRDAILKGRVAGLTPDQIHYAMTTKASQRSIAQNLGVNQSTISRLRSRHAEET